MDEIALSVRSRICEGIDLFCRGRRRWPVAAGRWPVGGGPWPVAAGRWPLAGGRWALGRGRWPLTGGRWPVAAGCWAVTAGRWPLAGGRWPLAGGYPGDLKPLFPVFTFWGTPKDMDLRNAFMYSLHSTLLYS